MGRGLAEVAARRWGAAALVVCAVGLGTSTVLTAATIDAAGPVLWLVLGMGGVAFGVFTASAFSLVLAKVPVAATSSVSGLLPTAQQLGGTFGVALAGVAYTAPAPSPAAAFWHAMAYEAVVFALAAVATAVLHRGRSPATPAAMSHR
jgi:hypothetical protein